MSTAVSESKMDALIKYAEFNRYGYMAFTLIILGCLGGLVLGLGGILSDPILIVTIFFNMTAAVLMVAMAPMKLVLPSSILAAGLNLLLIAFLIITG